MFCHLAQLHRRFCQIPTSPSRIGQTVELSKSMSTQSWFFVLVLGSSPGLWAAPAATYCPSRAGELPKQNMTKSHKRWDGKLCKIMSSCCDLWSRIYLVAVGAEPDNPGRRDGAGDDSRRWPRWRPPRRPPAPPRQTGRGAPPPPSQPLS